jgi:hypothetical protein
MTTKLTLGKDTNSNVTYELQVSDTIYRTTLAANVAQTLTIPPNMTRAFFSFSNGTDVWVAYSGTASLPTGAFLQNNSELNPVARYSLIPGNTLSFISDTTAYVEVAFFTNNINGY